MRRLLVLCASLAAASAFGQYSTGFEPGEGYFGSAAGTVLSGQQGWYLPAGSSDYNVHNYAGNALGVAANPGGGENFAGRDYPGGTTFARGQHDLSFAGPNVWLIEYDVLAKFNGTLPSANNIGSFSLQPAGNRQLIMLNRWTDFNTAATWNAGYNVFDAAGLALPTQVPSAAWDGLVPNRWYHQATIVDFGTNVVVQVRLTDKVTNVTDTVNPTGWYLQGGAGATTARPTGIRLFAGGSGATAGIGNVLAFDNLNIVPEPASMIALALGAGALALRRRRR